MAAVDTKDLEVAHQDGHERLGDDRQNLKAEAGVADAIAADYVDPGLVISPEENKRLRRKIWRNLIPIMCVAYITQSLDKGTLGSASIMGWIENVGAKGQDYALTSTVFWCGLIVGEPIVNQFVRKLPVAKVLALSMLVWSALVMGLGFSLNVDAVFGIRFILGMAESSFGPVLTTITVQWFQAGEQTLIATTWQAMLGVSSAVGNLLAYGFYHVTGKDPLYGWQWLTICISIISFCSTAIIYFFLPDSPPQARWATDDEKTKFVERVRANDQGLKQKVWRSEQAWEAARDPITYLLFLMYLTQSTIVGGLNTFSGLLVNRAFGFSVLTSLLVGIPQNIFQVLLYFLAAFLNRRFGQTVYIMISYFIVNIAGSVVLLTVAPNQTTRGGLLVAFYLMQACQATQPSMYAMLSRNIAGQSKKSVVYSVFFIAWAAGNAIGPQLFQSAWAPRYYNSLYIHLGLYVIFIIDVLVMRIIFVRRNAKRNARQNGAMSGMHLQAFADMTDLQNEDFRYSY